MEQAERENNIKGRLKTSKIQLGYYSQENAVRISTVSKIGITDKSNPCLEGTASCGENTICVPTSDEAYEVKLNIFKVKICNYQRIFLISVQCQCKNGFTYAATSPENESPDICVDIDECRSSHICSEFAECINRNGGYECRCLLGYTGDGYQCERIVNRSNFGRITTTPNYGTQIEGCVDCSENAECVDGVCTCNSGFIGNGHDCRMICALNEVFNGATCVKISTVEEGEFFILYQFISVLQSYTATYTQMKFSPIVPNLVVYALVVTK